MRRLVPPIWLVGAIGALDLLGLTIGGGFQIGNGPFSALFFSIFAGAGLLVRPGNPGESKRRD
jgi:hypothetical protein